MRPQTGVESDLGLSSEAGQTSGDLTSVSSVLILQQRGGLHPVRGDPEAVRQTDPVPDLVDGLPDTVRVDLADPHTPVQLEPVLPLLEVHGAGDGRAVVGDEGLQRAVEEQAVLLRPPQPGPTAGREYNISNILQPPNIFIHL